MSVEKKYETRMVEQAVCTEQIIRCDICETEINTREEYWTANATLNNSDAWHPNYDFKLYDLCCEDCVHEQLDKFFGEDSAVHFEVDKHNTAFTRF